MQPCLTFVPNLSSRMMMNDVSDDGGDEDDEMKMILMDRQ